MKKTVVVFFYVVMMLFIMCACSQYHDPGAVAKVEQYIIYQDDLDKIMQQIPSENKTILESDILEDLIEQALVLAYADKNNIKVSDEEVHALIEEYKTHYLKAFERGIKIYGETAFLEGQRERMVFQKVYDDFCKTLSPNDVNGEAVQDYFKDKGIHIKKEDEEAIINLYSDELKGWLFKKWIMSLKDEFKVEIFKAQLIN